MPFQYKPEQGAQFGGVGFAGLLTIAFVVLKLTHTIGWSWYWVLSPIWLPLAVLMAVFFMAFLALALKAIYRGLREEVKYVRRLR
jgi:nitrate/nitrite transporter NarK